MELLQGINWNVWMAPGIAALLGFVVFIAGFSRLLRLRLVTGSFGAVSGALLMALGFGAGLIGLNLHTYNRLSFEQPVAEISIVKRGEQDFIATLRTPEGEPVDYELKGDQWMLDARVLKWKPWANVLGLDAMYRLDRISGRYSTAAEEVSLERTAYDLAEDPGLDLWTMAQKYKQLAPMVDAGYGSGTYLPMVDGAAYEVSLTQSGLVARPTNAAAQEATRTW